MDYRRVPYAIRYLVALASWLAIISLDIILRIMFLPAMPFFWLWTGAGQTQTSAQLSVNLVDFYTRPLMRMPRLLRRSRSPANRYPKTGPVQRIGDSGA